MMISLRIELADLSLPLTEHGNAVRFGRSRIEAFASRMVRLVVTHDPVQTVVRIGEVGSTTGSGNAAAWSVRFEELDFEAIEMVLRPDQRSLILRRTVRPGTPLYVSLENRVLVASWRFEEAVSNLGRRTANREACALYLTHGPTVTREQVIAGVSMLWPGETLTVTDGKASYREVDDDAVPVPAVLANGARATDMLKELIRDAASPAVRAAAAPTLEVSGGLDSACVAVATRALRDDFASYGLLHHGAVGVQQRERRDELIGLLSLDDAEFPPDAPAPIAGLSVAENRITPLDDNHRQACAHAVDNLPAKADLVLTGIGGDELAMTRTFSREPWELRGTCCPSALVSVAARADMFMRRGIWVSNPLTASSVVDFCRALPARLRQARTINLLMLARAGLSDGFLFPRHVEGFGHTMQREAALFDFDAAMADSVIGDLRLFDFSDLLQKAADASNGGFSYRLLFDLHSLMKLETVLRRHLG